MEWLFGRKKTPEEVLRENQRMLKKAMRYVSPPGKRERPSEKEGEGGRGEMRRERGER
jgi:charged multivesicular body protein 2A